MTLPQTLSRIFVQPRRRINHKGIGPPHRPRPLEGPGDRRQAPRRRMGRDPSLVARLSPGWALISPATAGRWATPPAAGPSPEPWTKPQAAARHRAPARLACSCQGPSGIGPLGRRVQLCVMSLRHCGPAFTYARSSSGLSRKSVSSFIFGHLLGCANSIRMKCSVPISH